MELAWVLQGEKDLIKGGAQVLGRGAERVKKPWGTALGVHGVILDFWALKTILYGLWKR